MLGRGQQQRLAAVVRAAGLVGAAAAAAAAAGEAAAGAAGAAAQRGAHGARRVAAARSTAAGRGRYGVVGQVPGAAAGRSGNPSADHCDACLSAAGTGVVR